MLIKNKKIRAIDLFAGIGGMRIGFERSGFEIVYSNDIDKYSCQTYRANFGEIDERDIREVRAEELPNFEVLLGGFPCQPFSMIGKRDGLADPRGQLFNEIVRILNVKKPRAFVLENVKNLINHNRGETFNYIKNALENAGGGYSVFFEVLNSKNFGVPQQRERTYIVGIKSELTTFVFPQKDIISLGEIVVSYPWVLANSKSQGKLLDEAVAELVEHATLHLLGIHHD